MRGYGQFCPVAKAAEIVAERWTPLVLRELLCGSRRFSDLRRGVPLMSPTLLAQRLEQLEDAGIVRSVPRPHGRGREYELTAAGEELRPLIDRLGEWGQRWARARIGRDDLDAGLLMWGIHRRIDVGALPPDRVVVRFDFRGAPATMRCPRTWWLLLARSEVDRRVGHLLLRPSTYISGLERGKQNPTIGALIRLATALEAGLDHVVVPGAAAPRP